MKETRYAMRDNFVSEFKALLDKYDATLAVKYDGEHPFRQAVGISIDVPNLLPTPDPVTWQLGGFIELPLSFDKEDL